MRKYRKICMVVKENLMEWRGNYRIWTIAMVIAVVLGRYIIPACRFASANNLDYPISIFPLLMGDQINSNGLPKVIIFFGGVALLSNAPFFDKQKPYLVVRSGRRNWWKGECLYIAVAAFLYLLWISIISCIYLSPVTQISAKWGSLIESVVGGSVNHYEALNGIQCPAVVVYGTEYLDAVLYSYVSAWIVLTLLGFIVYAINLYSTKRWLGVAVAVFIILVDPVLYAQTSLNTRWYLLFSPVNWCSMENLSFLSGSGNLTVGYVIGMGIILLLALSAIIGMRIRQVDLFADN